VPVQAERPAGLDSQTTPGDVLMRPHARWVPASWSELPGWDNDRTAEVWPALLRSCERPAPGWANICAQAKLGAPADDAAVRVWLQGRLNPYRIESQDGSAQGLTTGYFEPIIAASRKPQGSFQVPLYAPPADLASRKPYWTRQELDTLPAAQAAIRGRELAYLADPLALLSLQIQGSGRLQLSEPDGSQKTVRMAYAGHNDQPYKSVGKWLIEQGELRADQASWPGIRAGESRLAPPWKSTSRPSGPDQTRPRSPFETWSDGSFTVTITCRPANHSPPRIRPSSRRISTASRFNDSTP
jgi:membrane-bound lytic murein transglycosylase A